MVPFDIVVYPEADHDYVYRIGVLKSTLVPWDGKGSRVRPRGCLPRPQQFSVKAVRKKSAAGQSDPFLVLPRTATAPRECLTGTCRLV